MRTTHMPHLDSGVYACGHLPKILIERTDRYIISNFGHVRMLKLRVDTMRRWHLTTCRWLRLQTIRDKGRLLTGGNVKLRTVVEFASGKGHA